MELSKVMVKNIKQKSSKELVIEASFKNISPEGQNTNKVKTTTISKGQTPNNRDNLLDERKCR